MMGDLFLSPEELRNINEGAPDDRRKQLMVQFIPQFEIDNPTKLRNLLFRSYAMYRIALQDPILLDRIKRECGGLDIEKEFEQLADIPMVNWLSLVFGVYVALAIHTQQEFLEKPEIFITRRSVKRTLTSFLNCSRLISMNYAPKSARNVPSMNALIWFRSSPHLFGRPPKITTSA